MPDLDAFMRRLLDEFVDKFVAKLGEDRAVELAEKEPERLQAVIDDAVMGIIETSGQGLAEQLRRDGPAMLAHRRAERRGFEKQLARGWARPFALAEMAMVVASEAGETFNEKHRPQAIDDNDLVFEVLTRLHARACRIAEEVLTLLKSGFGQAALARWRSLHEVAVVASFIEEHDQDTAERYLLHEHIESWCAMNEMQASADRLDLEPFTEEELRDVQATKDDLTARYGQEYANPYGWAHAAVVADDPTFKGRVAFKHIEKAAALDHLRPYYRLASHGTHANPKGILFTPDLLDGHDEVLLAGPSSTGFSDPGQSALISLMQVTATLLTSKSDESAALVLTALLSLTDEAAQAYAETQQAVEEGRDLPRYGPIARLRYSLGPRLAAERARARQIPARARARVGARWRQSRRVRGGPV